MRGRLAEQAATESAFPVTHSLHDPLYTSQGVLCPPHTHTPFSSRCFQINTTGNELKLLIALHVLQGAQKRPFGCSQSAHTSPAPRASQVEGGGWHPSKPAGSFHTSLRSSTHSSGTTQTGSDSSHHTHEITAVILPQAADASRRRNHNPKRAARTAGISRASGLFCRIS